MVNGLYPDEECYEKLPQKYLDEVNSAIQEEIAKEEEYDSYSADPEGWLAEYCSAENVKKWSTDHSSAEFGSDILYVFLVSEILRITKEDEIWMSGQIEDEETEENVQVVSVGSKSDVTIQMAEQKTELDPHLQQFLHTCPKIQIAVALVSEEHLERLEDPLKTSLKLGAAIREQYNYIYPQKYCDLFKIVQEFSRGLIEECMSHKEIEYLMDIKDESVLLDLETGKFYDIVQMPIYKHLYQEKIFWEEKVYDSFVYYVLSGVRRFLLLILWNMAYPFIEVYNQLYNVSKNQFHDKLFSPISCFIADFINYFIMMVLISIVVLEKHPDQKSTRDLVSLYHQGIVTVDHPRLKNGPDGIVLVELEKNPMSLVTWTLFFCLLARILIEFFQLVDSRVWALSNRVPNDQRFCTPLYTKLKIYLKSDMNKVDIMMIAVLITAFMIDFHYSYSPCCIFGRVCINQTDCDDSFDYTLEARRVTYMSNFYSVALLLTLARLFYCIFLFIPIIGPILQSMQKMLKDVFTVVVILAFFSVGFFIPLFAIIQCYLSVHKISDDKLHPSNNELLEESLSDDTEVFETMDTPTHGFFTMILSIMEGQLTYSDDLYKSKDKSTNTFFFIIMIFYYLIFGLLCINLLIALISKRYDIMMENKNRDWRFAQFRLMMDYLGKEIKMPFFFPFNLFYVLFHIHTNCICKKQKDGKSMYKPLKRTGQRKKFIKTLLKRKKARRQREEHAIRKEEILTIDEKLAAESEDKKVVTQYGKSSMITKLKDKESDNGNEDQIVENLPTREEESVLEKEEFVTKEKELVTKEDESVTKGEELVTKEEDLVTKLKEEHLVTKEEELVTKQEDLVNKTGNLIEDKTFSFDTSKAEELSTQEKESNTLKEKSITKVEEQNVKSREAAQQLIGDEHSNEESK